MHIVQRIALIPRLVRPRVKVVYTRDATSPVRPHGATTERIRKLERETKMVHPVKPQESIPWLLNQDSLHMKALLAGLNIVFKLRDRSDMFKH